MCSGPLWLQWDPHAHIWRWCLASSREMNCHFQWPERENLIQRPPFAMGSSFVGNIPNLPFQRMNGGMTHLAKGHEEAWCMGELSVQGRKHNHRSCKPLYSTALPIAPTPHISVTYNFMTNSPLGIGLSKPSFCSLKASFFMGNLCNISTSLFKCEKHKISSVFPLPTRRRRSAAASPKVVILGVSLVSKSPWLGSWLWWKTASSSSEMSGSRTEPINGYCWWMESTVREIGRKLWTNREILQPRKD